MNPELTKYIREARAAGKSEELIKGELRTGGWSEADLAQAFAASGPAPVMPAAASATPAVATTAAVATSTATAAAGGYSFSYIIGFIVALAVLGGGGWWLRSQNSEEFRNASSEASKSATVKLDSCESVLTAEDLRSIAGSSGLTFTLQEDKSDEDDIECSYSAPGSDLLSAPHVFNFTASRIAPSDQGFSTTADLFVSQGLAKKVSGLGALAIVMQGTGQVQVLSRNRDYLIMVTSFAQIDPNAITPEGRTKSVDIARMVEARVSVSDAESTSASGTAVSASVPTATSADQKRVFSSCAELFTDADLVAVAGTDASRYKLEQVSSGMLLCTYTAQSVDRPLEPSIFTFSVTVNTDQTFAEYAEHLVAEGEARKIPNLGYITIDTGPEWPIQGISRNKDFLITAFSMDGKIDAVEVLRRIEARVSVAKPATADTSTAASAASGSGTKPNLSLNLESVYAITPNAQNIPVGTKGEFAIGSFGLRAEGDTFELERLLFSVVGISSIKMLSVWDGATRVGDVPMKNVMGPRVFMQTSPVRIAKGTVKVFIVKAEVSSTIQAGDTLRVRILGENETGTSADAIETKNFSMKIQGPLVRFPDVNFIK